MTDTSRERVAEATLGEDRELWRLMQSVLELPALTAAVRLGVFEALKEAPCDVDLLADRVGATPRATRALVQFAAALGFVTLQRERADLTPTGRAYLLRSSPSFWGGLLNRVDALRLDATQFSAACRSERPAFPAAPELWQALAQTPAAVRAFTEGAHSRAGFAAERLSRAGFLPGAGSLLDVGGGKGTYACAFARANPELNVYLLELGAICPEARRFVRRAGLTDRVRIHEADMFTAVWPSPMDGVWFSDIFHDWGPPECRSLAERAFESLRPGRHVFVNEVLLDDNHAGPIEAVSYGLAMLVSTRSGRQYTLAEVGDILRSQGFEQVMLLVRAGAYSVVRATKPE